MVQIEDEREIAEIFNDYFIRKIEDLKDNIDSTQIKDPMVKLKEKVKNKNLHFSMKTVSEKKVREVMAEMRKKIRDNARLLNRGAIGATRRTNIGPSDNSRGKGRGGLSYN